MVYDFISSERDKLGACWLGFKSFTSRPERFAQHRLPISGAALHSTRSRFCEANSQQSNSSSKPLLEEMGGPKKELVPGEVLALRPHLSNVAGRGLKVS